MKKCIFTNKLNNTSKECLVGNIGALVYNICNDVKSMNDVIRWCNSLSLQAAKMAVNYAEALAYELTKCK